MTTILIVVCMITNICTLLNLYSAHRDYVQWKMFHGEWPELIQGYEVLNMQPYAKEKKYILIKQIDGHWYFEAASDDIKDVCRIGQKIVDANSHIRIRVIAL